MRAVMMSRIQENLDNNQANVVRMKAPRRRGIKKVCNLCRLSYDATSKFDRFCAGCKEHSELYHFHEWLPAC